MPRTTEPNSDPLIRDIKALLHEQNRSIQTGQTHVQDTLEAVLAPHPAAYAGGPTLLTFEDYEAYKEQKAQDGDQFEDDEEEVPFWNGVADLAMPNTADRMHRVMRFNSALLQGCPVGLGQAILKGLGEMQAKQVQSERQLQAQLEAFRSELLTTRGGRAPAAAAFEAGTSAGAKRQRGDQLSRGDAADTLRKALNKARNGSGSKMPPDFQPSAFDAHSDEDAENLDQQVTCIKVILNDASTAKTSARLLALKFKTDRATQARIYQTSFLQPWLFQRRTKSLPPPKEILIALIEAMADEPKPLVSKDELNELDVDRLLEWAELLLNSHELLKEEFEKLESAAWQAFGLQAKAFVLDNLPVAMRDNIDVGFSAHLDSLLAGAKYMQLAQLLQPLQNLARMPPVEEDGGTDDEAQVAAPGPVLPPRPRQRAVQGAVKGLVGMDGNAAQIEELDKISSEMLPTERSLFFTDGKFLKTPDGTKHFVLELDQMMHRQFIGGVYKLERTGLAVTIFFVHHALDLTPKARAPHKGQLWFAPSPSFRTIPAKLSAIAACLKSPKYVPTEVAELAALQSRA